MKGMTLLAAGAATLLAASLPLMAAQEGTATGAPPPAATTAAEPAAKPQTTCPVMGGAIDKSLYGDHGGKRIYACCRGCLRQIRKDPEAIIRKLEAEGITLDKTPPPAAKGKK
ncbi:MAG: hypothetical protein WC789_02935 [Lentisphaeria bacterium]|jgi:hypothetical protein